MSPKIIYFLFFLSGAAGLIYEIVWGRLLILIFGSTTNSQVAVISAFLGGLALGSLLFGKIADNLSGKDLIKTYSRLEFGVGLTAALTLLLIPVVRNFYGFFSDGSSTTFSQVVIKFVLTIIVLLIPTTLMGATLPILVNFINSQIKSVGKSVSLLYAVNTFGAVIGVLASAFILIELFGLRNTLLIAVASNFAVGSLARFIKIKATKIVIDSKIKKSASPFMARNIFVIFSFSLSGLIAIAYEILWTRIFTPTVGTFIYAFAAILAIYLLGIAIGSLAYKKFSDLIKNKNLAFAICQFGIGFFALGTLYLTSSQMDISQILAQGNLFHLADFAAFDPRKLSLLILIPATIFMGLTFPAVVSLLGTEKNAGFVVGLTYFANTIGSIIGGFLASFFLIPSIGSSQSIIFLSLFNFAIATLFILREKKLTTSIRFSTLFLTITLFIFTSWLFIYKRESLYSNINQWRINWAKEKGFEYVFIEDETASVFAYHDARGDQNLFIDGVSTTGKVVETKLMAHIPILLHNNPQKVLVVAFGMGTTFRSSLAYDIETDVVELVPSVPPLVRLFQPDKERVLANPKGKVIINDGRNYIYLTKYKYDIVTIDPPPPFNAAGTTVLYSKEFYEDISKKLNEKGIVSQWIWFGSRKTDISMAIKSFTEVFPYIVAFKTPSGFGGIFLEGSFSPIIVNKAKLDYKLNLSKPNEDLKEELNYNLKLSQVLDLALADKESIEKAVSGYQAVTDNHPQTEYFLLRHKFMPTEDLTIGSFGENFINSIKSQNSPLHIR